MKKPFLTAIFLALPCLTAPAQAAIVITFDQASDINGFTKAPTADAGSSITWTGTGGNPGGHLSYNESASGGVDRVLLPTIFLGDQSSYFGGTFEFDHRLTGGTNHIPRDNDVELIGAGLILRNDLPTPSLNTWMEHSISLNEAGGWIDSATSAPATDAQILQVLGDLQAIILHTDFRNSPPERSDFDNIALRAVPEPSTTALFGLAGALALVRRRRTG